MFIQAGVFIRQNTVYAVNIVFFWISIPGYMNIGRKAVGVYCMDIWDVIFCENTGNHMIFLTREEHIQKVQSY